MTRIKYMIVLVCLLVNISSHTVYAQENDLAGITLVGETYVEDNLSVTVEVPDRVVCFNEYTDKAKVTVTELSERDFEGTVKVSTIYGTEDSIISSYSKKISVEKGGTWSEIFDIKAAGYLLSISLIIFDENGEEVFNYLFSVEGQREDVTYMNIVGVLTDGEIPDINAGTESKATQKYISEDYPDILINSYSEQNFPDSLDVLQRMNYIVVNDFDMEKLSEKQIKSLTDYMYLGGKVIVGTGAGCEKVLKEFEDVIDYSFSGTDYMEYDISNELVMVDENESNETRNYNGLYSNVEWDSEYVSANEWDEFWLKYYKSGVVSRPAYTDSWIKYLSIYKNNNKEAYAKEDTTRKIVGADITIDGEVYHLGEGPVKCTYVRVGKGKLYVYRCNLLDLEYGVDLTDYNINSLDDVTENTQGGITDVFMGTKSVIAYAILIVLYILLISCVVYILLKKLNKGHYLCIAVPAVSVVFCVVFLILNSFHDIDRSICNFVKVSSMSGKGNVVDSTRLSVVTTDDREYMFDLPGIGDMRYMGINGTNDFDYVMEGQTEQYRVNSYYNYGYFHTGIKKEMEQKWSSISAEVQIDEKDSYDSIIIKGNMPYVVNEFFADEVKDSSEHFDVDFSNDGEKIKITNTTEKDFKDVVVKFMQGYRYIGDLKKNESAVIKNDDTYTKDISTVFYEEHGYLSSQNVMLKKNKKELISYKKTDNIYKNYYQLIQYGDLVSEEMLILGVCDDNSYGRDFDGINIAYQIETVKNGFGPKKIVYDIGDSSVSVGEVYDARLSDYGVEDGFNTYVYTVGDDSLLLYDIPDGMNITSIHFEEKADREYIMSKIECPYCANVMIYDYAKGEYIYLEDIKSYENMYSVDRPLRIKVLTVEGQENCLIPDYVIEMEAK